MKSSVQLLFSKSSAGLSGRDALEPERKLLFQPIVNLCAGQSRRQVASKNGTSVQA